MPKEKDYVGNIGKTAYWLAITYLDRMRPDWAEIAEEEIGVPCAYCVHSVDLDAKGEDRKPHVHWVIAFGQTTTGSHIRNMMRNLSREGEDCTVPVKACTNIRGSYDYLIHDTEKAQRDGKHLYDRSERVELNGFDIGLFEQLSEDDKARMCQELCDFVIERRIKNMADAYLQIFEVFGDTSYFKVYKSNNALIDRLCRGNYLKYDAERMKQEECVCDICRKPGCEPGDYFEDKNGQRHYWHKGKCAETFSEIMNEHMKAGTFDDFFE